MGRRTRKITGTPTKLYSYTVVSISRLPPLNLNKHETTRCHLCGEDFLCAVTRGWMCPCAEIELTPEQSEQIQWKTGSTCVCNHCLIRLRDEMG